MKEFRFRLRANMWELESEGSYPGSRVHGVSSLQGLQLRVWGLGFRV